LSAFGAVLQILTGAPRVLQAIGKDRLFPFFGAFSVSNKKETQQDLY